MPGGVANLVERVGSGDFRLDRALAHEPFDHAEQAEHRQDSLFRHPFGEPEAIDSMAVGNHQAWVGLDRFAGE